MISSEHSDFNIVELWNQTLYVCHTFCILHAGFQMGFESLNFVRIEGDETPVRVRVNGQCVQNFFFDYTQGT